MKGLASILTPGVRLITRAWVQGWWISSMLLSHLPLFADFGFLEQDIDKETMYKISEGMVFIDPVVFEPLIESLFDERRDLNGLSYLEFNISDNLIPMSESGVYLRDQWAKDENPYWECEDAVRQCDGFLDAWFAKKIAPDPDDPEDGNQSPIGGTRQYGYKSLGRLENGCWVFKLHYWGGWNGSPYEALAVLRLGTRVLLQGSIIEDSAAKRRRVAVFQLVGYEFLWKFWGEIKLIGDQVIIEWEDPYTKKEKKRVLDFPEELD